MSSCRSCGAPIRWALSAATQKMMPVDVDPVLGGNLELRHVGGGANPIAHVVTPEPLVAGYVSHFSTCPHAAEHRRH